MTLEQDMEKIEGQINLKVFNLIKKHPDQDGFVVRTTFCASMGVSILRMARLMGGIQAVRACRDAIVEQLDEELAAAEMIEDAKSEVRPIVLG